MTARFKNKYRIASTRASWWDYGADAAYFVTICTKNGISYFGKVTNGVMELSNIGKIAHQCWEEIPVHFPFVILGEFVVMPDHVHGIVVIDKTITDDANNVDTQDLAYLPLPKTTNKFGPQSKNLASIIRGFKIGVTKSARLINSNFGWQSRYHDRIIRDQSEHDRIALYIQNNPMNW